MSIDPICPECGCVSHDNWCSRYDFEAAKERQKNRPMFVELTWEGMDSLLTKMENPQDLKGFEERVKKALEKEFDCKVEIDWQD